MRLSIASLLQEAIFDPFEAFLNPSFESLDTERQRAILHDLISYVESFLHYFHDEPVDFCLLQNKIIGLQDDDIQDILDKLHSIISNHQDFDRLCLKI